MFRAVFSQCQDNSGHFVLDISYNNIKRYSSPITGLNRPTGYQEDKAPTFLDIGT